MDKNRLFWASRRGMLELDLILMPFVEQVYPNLSPVEQQWYQQLLDEQDQDLFRWLLNRQEPPSHTLRSIVQIIRANSA